MTIPQPAEIPRLLAEKPRGARSHGGPTSRVTVAARAVDSAFGPLIRGYGH